MLWWNKRIPRSAPNLACIVLQTLRGGGYDFGIHAREGKALGSFSQSIFTLLVWQLFPVKKKKRLIMPVI